MTQVNVVIRGLIAAFMWLSLATGAVLAEENGYAVGDMALGSADAPVTIIEYASKTCPHCARFHNETFKSLKDKYIDTGKVRMIYREFPFDPLALRAAMLARCAGPDRFFGMVSILFKQQRAWGTAKDPMAALGKLARLGGITGERFEACMRDKGLADSIIKTRLSGQEKFGVTSTPSFIINGTLRAGALTLEEFDKILAEHLPKS